MIAAVALAAKRVRVNRGQVTLDELTALASAYGLAHSSPEASQELYDTLMLVCGADWRTGKSTANRAACQCANPQTGIISAVVTALGPHARGEWPSKSDFNALEQPAVNVAKGFCNLLYWIADTSAEASLRVACAPGALDSLYAAMVTYAIFSEVQEAACRVLYTLAGHNDDHAASLATLTAGRAKVLVEAVLANHSHCFDVKMLALGTMARLNRGGAAK